MDLYFFRHGLAEDASRSGLDRDRELTAVGIEKTRAAGQAFRKLGVQWDLALASPYARAWKTAEILVEQLDCQDRLQACGALASGQPPAPLLAELQRQSPQFTSILLVGHEPDLSHLISLLLTGSPRLSLTMKKGGLCRLSCHSPEPGTAALEWLLTSKLFDLMA